MPGDAATPLRVWHQVVRRKRYSSPSEVKVDFPTASIIGKWRTVFNVGGNKSRLVAVVHFNRGKVYVRHVLTHREYDQGRWNSD